MSEASAFPCLCRLKARARADSLLSSVRGLRGMTASVALGLEQRQVRVLISATGETALLEPDMVVFDLAPDLAMEVMDALEEAIEDAIDGASADRGKVSALEGTLALFDRCLDDG